jgi:DNA-binding transcriptional LysR family regulator
VELRHFRYFVALAEELHFGRAARRLHISQPPLSQQIAALEEEIGVPLLRRTSRTVELTEAGRRFLGEARETLAQARNAVALARRAAQGEVGRLQVGFVPVCGVIPVAVRRYVMRYPDVRVSLRNQSSAEQLESIVRGTIDVGFVHGPVSVPGLECRTVETHALVAAIPTRHRLSSRRTIEWRALQGEPFIGFPRASAPAAYDVLMGRLREAGFDPNVVHETDSLLARLRMVGAGLGVALVPSYASRFPRHGVTLRPLGPPRAIAQIGLVHCPAHLTPAVARFMAVVGEAVERPLAAVERKASPIAR